MKILDWLLGKSKENELAEVLWDKAIKEFENGNRFELGLIINSYNRLATEVDLGSLPELLTTLHDALPKKVIK